MRPFRNLSISLLHNISAIAVTAPFNNMWTLKFKAQPTNAFFGTVNEIFEE